MDTASRTSLCRPEHILTRRLSPRCRKLGTLDFVWMERQREFISVVGRRHRDGSPPLLPLSAHVSGRRLGQPGPCDFICGVSFVPLGPLPCQPNTYPLYVVPSESLSTQTLTLTHNGRFRSSALPFRIQHLIAFWSHLRAGPARQRLSQESFCALRRVRLWRCRLARLRRTGLSVWCSRSRQVQTPP